MDEDNGKPVEVLTYINLENVNGDFINLYDLTMQPIQLQEMTCNTNEEYIVLADDYGGIASNSATTSPGNQVAENAVIPDVEEVTPMDTCPVLKRKRLRKVHNWKSTIKSKKYQSGQAYTTIKGVSKPAKQIKDIKNCLTNCKFKCSEKITSNERKRIFENYYAINQQGKNNYIGKTTERTLVNRRTNPNRTSRRNYSFKYFFDLHDERFQVELRSESSKRKPKRQNCLLEPPKEIQNNREVPENKKKHLEAMFRYMGEQDKLFYRTILHIDTSQQF